MKCEVEVVCLFDDVFFVCKCIEIVKFVIVVDVVFFDFVEW